MSRQSQEDGRGDADGDRRHGRRRHRDTTLARIQSADMLGAHAGAYPKRARFVDRAILEFEGRQRRQLFLE